MIDKITALNILKSDAFVSMITENFIKQDKRFKECQEAERQNKPMYAIIKKGVDLGRFKQFNWRKTYVFESQQDLFDISLAIKKDLQWYYSVGV